MKPSSKTQAEPRVRLPENPSKSHLIGITQRVEIIPEYHERRDALDQAWSRFLQKCGLVPVILPNHLPCVKRILGEIPLSGFILTGGNNLAALGGDAPERDEVETFLVKTAIAMGRPLLGICRGMQLIQDFFGVRLGKIAGHVTKEQHVLVDEKTELVNSYHAYGTTSTTPDLKVFAVADDGVIEGVSHHRHRISGIMWHPERMDPFRKKDVFFFRNFFGKGE